MVGRLSRVACLALACYAQVPDTVQEHFAAAQAAQRSGNFDHAVNEYRAILLLQPDFAEVHMNLGLVLHAQGKFDESAAALGRSLKLKPALFAAGLFQGMNYCKLGRAGDAVPLLTKAAAEQPANKEARFWLASALVGSGKAARAVIELEGVPPALRDDVDILQLLGEAYQKAAREQAEHVKSLAPESLERRLLLGESYLAQQEWMSAEVHFKRLSEEKAPPPRTFLGLGISLLRLSAVEPAIRSFQQELLADQYSVEAYCGLAEALLLQGKLEEALAALEKGLAIRPQQAIKAVLAEAAGVNPNEKGSEPYRVAAAEWSRAGQPARPAIVLGLALAATRLGKTVNLPPFPAQSKADAVPPSRAAALQCFQQRRYEQAILGLRRYSDVEARFALARSYVETDEPAKAARELRLLLQTNANHIEARLWLGKAYRDLALAAFTRLLVLQPDSYRAHQLLAESFEARQQYGKAMDEYRLALKTRPNLPGLHQAIGQLELKNLRLEEAAAEFEKELALNSFDADANTALAGIYITQEQHEKALPLLLRALKTEPDLVEAHRRLGKVYFSLKQFDKAEAELKLALEGDVDGSTRYILAKTYRSLGRASEADKEFQAVVRIKAERLKQTQSQAERVRNLDRVDNPTAAALQALQLDPSNPDRNLDYTRLLLEEERYDEAIAVTQKGIKTVPDPYALHLRLGAIELMKGSPDTAETSFRTAIALHPEIPLGYVAVAKAYLKAGRAAEASAVLGDARSKVPEDFSLEYFSGLAWESQDRQAEAMEAYARAAKLDGKVPEPHIKLGKLLLDAGQPERAREELQRAVELNRDDSRAHFQLSRVYAKLGDFENARKSAARAKELRGTQPEASFDQPRP